MRLLYRAITASACNATQLFLIDALWLHQNSFIDTYGDRDASLTFKSYLFTFGILYESIGRFAERAAMLPPRFVAHPVPAR